MTDERFIYCQQRSEEWLQLHVGRLTASHAADVLDFRKTGDKGPGAKRTAYFGKKIAETLTGLLDQDTYVSPQMEWGVAMEDAARRAYELFAGVLVDQIGFIIHPSIDRAGASPDGLLDGGGILEIKCPASSTHIKWAKEGVVPEEHRAQMYFEMACAGAAFGDFVSYDPRLPAAWLAPDGTRRNLQLFVRRLEADPVEIAKLEGGFAAFLSEMDADIAKMQAIFPEAEPEPEPVDDPLGISAEDVAWAAAGFPEAQPNEGEDAE